MKKLQFKHKVKLRKKQPDLLAYLSKLLLGILPLLVYLFIERSFSILKEIGINIPLPVNFLLVTILFLLANTVYVWFISPFSFSRTQRIKNILKKLIEANGFYYENKELNKIVLSMKIKFYWKDKDLYLEVYPNGGNFSNKMNELTTIFQTTFNMTVVSVQDDYADHTTYILSNTVNNYIDSTDTWTV